MNLFARVKTLMVKLSKMNQIKFNDQTCPAGQFSLLDLFHTRQTKTESLYGVLFSMPFKYSGMARIQWF